MISSAYLLVNYRAESICKDGTQIVNIIFKDNYNFENSELNNNSMSLISTLKIFVFFHDKGVNQSYVIPFNNIMLLKYK
jgi:hypothetical protein